MACEGIFCLAEARRRRTSKANSRRSNDGQAKIDRADIPKSFRQPVNLVPYFSEKKSMAKLDEFFKYMKEKGASDLHISSGEPPILRLHGEMVRLEYQPLSPAECQAL